MQGWVERSYIQPAWLRLKYLEKIPLLRDVASGANELVSTIPRPC
jgi:hypothetical protein